jgi:hypothetical protein
MTIMPLWVITMTDAPRPVLGALFALNTVMAVLLQVPASKYAISPAGSTRLLTGAALAVVVACPVLALSGTTSGWLTVAVLAVGVMLLTWAELWSASAQWWVTTEVPPPAQRGAYVGAANSVIGVAKVVGPAGLTFLAIGMGGWGLWVIAGIFVVTALVVRPLMSRVERTSRNVVDAPSLADRST